MLLSITILHAILSPAGAAGRPLALNITNAGESSYPSAWAGYRAVATYDMQHWFRVQDTSYDEAAGVLTIKHTPERAVVRYAYFAPYSLERHTELIMRMQVCQQMDCMRTHACSLAVGGWGGGGGGGEGRVKVQWRSGGRLSERVPVSCMRNPVR